MVKIVALSAGLICMLSQVAAVGSTTGFADITVTTSPEGSAKFSLQLGTDAHITGEGIVSTIGPCLIFGLCAPGTRVTGTTFLSSEDRGLHGTVTLGGETFTWFAPVSLGPVSAELNLSTTIDIPDVGPVPPEMLTLTAPFKASGALFAAGGIDPSFWNGPSVALGLGGEGIMTITLQLASPPPGTLYEFQSAHYEFFSIPEPGTGVLILSVLAGLCAFVRAGRIHRWHDLMTK